MGIRKGETIRVDGEKLDKTIRDIEGKNYKGMKISTFILQRDVSYYSKVIRTGVCNKDDFKTLCEYYEINPDDYIIKQEEPKEVTHNEETTKTPSQIVNLDALIIGINNLYQIEKKNSETVGELLRELKVTNTKINRLENVLGQLLTNSIPIKENSHKMVSALTDTRSTVATIQGRVKELLGKFKN